MAYVGSSETNLKLAGNKFPMYAIIDFGPEACAISNQGTKTNFILKSRNCISDESSDVSHTSGDAHDNQKFDNAHVGCMSMKSKLLPHLAHLKICIAFG